MKRQSAALATIAVTAAFVVAAGSGVAIGSGIRLVDGSGNINSCVKADTGAVRVASSTADCKKSELPLAWKQNAASSSPARLSVYIDDTLAGPLTAGIGYGHQGPEAHYLASDGTIKIALMRAPQYQVISTLFFAEPGCQGEPLLGSGSEGEYFEGNASLGMPGFFQTVGPNVTRFESTMSQPLGHAEVSCDNTPQGEGWLRAFASAERPHVPVVEIR